MTPSAVPAKAEALARGLDAELFALFLYLSFVETGDVRMFGPADAGVWQINTELIGSDSLLTGLIVYIDESWNEKHLSCESVDTERQSFWFIF